MAQQVQVLTTSDLSGKPDATTHTLRLDGREVTLDLTAEESSALKETLQPYFAAASSSRSHHTGSGQSPRSGRAARLKDIRAWARENGHQVSDRGPIRAHIVEAYDAACA